jgi:hypothetical protein
MNYASLAAALMALGISVWVLLGMDGVAESNDAFCHRDATLNGDAICVQSDAVQYEGKNLCFSPNLPNKCP